MLNYHKFNYFCDKSDIRMSFASKLTAAAFVLLSLLTLSCNKQDGPEEPEKIVVPEAVDLGLSVKWASFDVGAKQPGEVGWFVSWGETAPKDTYYKWENYAWCNRSQTRLTKYNFKESYGSNPDYRVALTPDDDIAYVVYGENWHVPTKEEVQELIDAPFITQSVEKVGGIACLKLTSTKTGQSIMFPAGGNCSGTMHPQGQNYAGYFWTAEIEYTTLLFQMDATYPSNAACLMVSPEVRTSGFTNMYMPNLDRAYGMNVRAVYGKRY